MPGTLPSGSALTPNVTQQALYAHRGAILHFLADPGDALTPSPAAEYFPDGLLLVQNGRVLEVGPADALLKRLSCDTILCEHPHALLIPGFVDTHIHYPQTDVIASGGRQLLDWLQDYTFPAEAAFHDPTHASNVADFFLEELMRNGTTTALVFGSVHKTSVDAFMQRATSRNLRMICGKVLMDRNCPENLQDTADTGIAESRALIQQWHGQQRLQYAITPRFAITSTPKQLQLAGELAQAFPDTYIHSHLAENHDEIAFVRKLFPEHASYLDVYQHFGLLRERAIYAHCIHLTADERQRMTQQGANVAFCPTSNLYLGSGLFDIAASDRAQLPFAMGTDVGGGSSFSMLRTLAAAYQVAQLQQQTLTPLRAFYLATRGGAKILQLDDKIGSFTAGCEADFVVLDLHATPLIARRSAATRRLDELLLVLMTLGDDRLIRHTYIMGERV